MNTCLLLALSETASDGCNDDDKRVEQGGDTAGSSIMQAIQTPKAGTSEPEVLALAPAPPQEGKGTDVPHSQWPTLIDDDPEKAKVKLLAETEDALAISFARLALLQLLAAGTKPVARVLDPPAFLSAIAPFFPRASSEHRPVFSASHLDSVVPVSFSFSLDFRICYC